MPHTPKPWIASRSYSVHTAAGGTIADVYAPTPAGFTEYHRERQANRDLIAAAPDLLEACTAGLAAFHQDYQGDAPPAHLARALELMRAAILRASGIA